MPVCRICGKEIPRGTRYKPERYKNQYFCSKECYEKKLALVEEQKQKKESKIPKLKEPDSNQYIPLDGTQRRKLTDLIQEIYGETANWGLLMANVRNIERDYNLKDNDFRLVMKYAMEFENYKPMTSLNLYQFEQFIVPTQLFREKIHYNKEIAKDLDVSEDYEVIKPNPHPKRIWRER